MYPLLNNIFVCKARLKGHNEQLYERYVLDPARCHACMRLIKKAKSLKFLGIKSINQNQLQC